MRSIRPASACWLNGLPGPKPITVHRDDVTRALKGRGQLIQLYWWQARGVYQVGRYRDSGEMVMIGQFVDRDAAIEMALPA